MHDGFVSHNFSDAFSYPIGQMWTAVLGNFINPVKEFLSQYTAVLGEHDRLVEEGHEQRMMVEKIVLHERFKEYHNDIGKCFPFFHY